ncbi:hypothetical protein [Pseudomonas frederiksbergensis]|uniref:HEPN AbiU2-like domain-containing protein n=1 Tax=Pseudomonas frederiksbergensis TaxID=104087 RepID=A0AB33EL19_9PSED|nr:hypothetical protein [Pseudomonas frederiksbergensis]ATE80182.1 hypothetical protein CNN82_28630 [Pseudomonas frederiksbergensis]
MISLKPNCTAITFKNMEKTKENFIFLMYGTIEKDRIDQEIQRNQEMVDGGYVTAGQIQDQLDYLKRLKADPNYQNGNLPRGVEKIILQVMESFTFWHSINEVDADFFLTQDNYIHNLINVSITFMVSCELAKLFNNKPEDFSLSNIWNHDINEIKKAKIASEDEIDYITEQFARNESTRSQAIKRFLDFRNKSVAHNDNDTGMQWSDFVSTINFVNRAWGIIDEYYSPNCFPRPIQLSDQLYIPLQPHFTLPQIEQMKEARLKLMEYMFKAASTNLLTGAQDNIKPFGDLKITVKIELQRK